MKTIYKLAAAAAIMASATSLGVVSANAQIGIRIGVPGVHIGIGVPAPAYYYGPGYYPPGPCDAYDHYYDGDCGYSVYDGPVLIDGVWVNGPHYYRWYNDQPYFWHHGGWHYWTGWSGVNFGWVRDEGWGWHNGHWDRGWGNAHWHDHDHGHDHDHDRDHDHGGDHGHDHDHDHDHH